MTVDQMTMDTLLEMLRRVTHDSCVLEYRQGHWRAGLRTPTQTITAGGATPTEALRNYLAGTDRLPLAARGRE